METVNHRPDFLLLYAAQLCTGQGMSPQELRNLEAMVAMLPRDIVPAEMSRKLRELRHDWTHSEIFKELFTYSYVKVTLHGGFETNSLIPKDRLVDNEDEDTEVTRFARLGAEEYLKRSNETEYNKVLKHRQGLLDQKKDGCDVEYELRLANKWVAAFNGWFHANDIEVSYTPQSAVVQRAAAKTYPEEELADFYVNCLISNGGEEPLQTQLEEFSGISQSTWSKKLKKPSLLQLIQKRIELVLDSQDFLIHAKTIIEQKAAKARLEDHREKAWGATSEPASALSDEEDRIINDLDNEKIAKMTEAQLMREILQFDPSYKPEDLREYSKEELSTLFRNLK